MLHRICRQKPQAWTFSSCRTYYNAADTQQKHKPGGFRPSQVSITDEPENPDVAKVISVKEHLVRAIRAGKPVVALESTIYTHGFPYPENVSLAHDLEEVVRRNGGIPATIGVLDGTIHVGLTKYEITSLASTAGKPETMKVSRRDIPWILGMGMTGRKLTGGTTVAATMMIAKHVGISVFGTGGLGGVHRGGQDTMDVSADLTELGRTPVAVVSSGCKSFLDIPRTLEYLETQGVTVCTFADGRTGDIDFPAFWTRDSGFKSPLVVQNAEEAAAMIFSQKFTASFNGILFANPIPEAFSIPKAEMDVAINQAIKEAAERGIHGHRNTPFILSKIKEITKALQIEKEMEFRIFISTHDYANLKANHRPIAKRTETSSLVSSSHQPKLVPSSPASPSRPDIVVFGSVAIDLGCNYTPEKGNSGTMAISPQLHTSNISQISSSIGGVGHNVALAAHLAGGSLSVQLCSRVANDLAGRSITTTMRKEGLVTDNLHIMGTSEKTAQYVAINDANKDLTLAMADMAIFRNPVHAQNTPSSWSALIDKEPKWAVVDANWHPGTIWRILDMCKRRTASTSNSSSARAIKTVYEPVSVPKSASLFDTKGRTNREDIQPFPLHSVDLSTPNRDELAAMHAAAGQSGLFEKQKWWEVIDALGIPSSGARDRFVSLTSAELTDAGVPQQSVQLLPYIPTILTKLGADGVLMTELLNPGDERLTDPDAAPYIVSRNSNGSTEIGGVYMRLFPAIERVEDPVSVNGVGDTFLGVLVAGLAKGEKLDEHLVDRAQKGAVMTLRSEQAVSPELGALARD